MKIFFAILGWVFGALFVVSAVVQYNDPDPWTWIFIYSVAALVSFGFALGRISFGVLLSLGIVALLGFFYTFPEKFEGFEIDGGDIKNIEEGREAFGLLIISIIMFIYALRTRYSRASKI
ncbi:transmembrane 220 family protein [Ulvibacterium sp.]|uniref:transmembrane 220 family protein n=1 Tax=Ulvibacterium sp. TaxID=2665914 RepID=UPI003BA8DC75